MAENNPPPSTTGADVPGQPFYDKTRAHLKRLLTQRQLLEDQLRKQEDQILKKETDYLGDTPQGNIITGFEGYTKGSSVVPGQRRRGNVVEASRVFSRSSVSFNGGVVCSSFFLLTHALHIYRLRCWKKR